jgi:glycosyltransferase involved in cell wall biosynthesis
MRDELEGSKEPRPRALDPSAVAVIIPVGGSAPGWDRCVQSLARLDPKPGEIVAAIDGPNDALAAGASEIGATVVVLENRGGPARARNRGVEASEGDILLFVDADVEVPVDFASRVAGLFDANPEISAVIGSYDDAPGDPGFCSRYRNLLHHYVHQHGRETASTFWSGCGAVRRRAFDEVGGFDEGYGDPMIEDIELGSRLLRAGHVIRLVKDLQVKHLKRWRLVDMLATDLWRRAVPWTELMLGQRRFVNDLNVKTRDRFSVVLAFLTLITLSAAWLWPPLYAVGAAAVVLLVALNAALFRFFSRRGGVFFAVGTAPLYWVYLLICGLGFAIGVVRHLVRGRRQPDGVTRTALRHRPAPPAGRP